MLIVDDASPDGSAEVAHRLAAQDSRVRVIAHTINKRHIATYNEGLAAVYGRYGLNAYLSMNRVSGHIYTHFSVKLFVSIHNDLHNQKVLRVVKNQILQPYVHPFQRCWPLNKSSISNISQVVHTPFIFFSH